MAEWHESLPERTLIKQPVNSTLRTEPGVLQLVERWKGRYEWCRDVLASLYSEDGVSYSTFVARAGTLSSYYNGVPNSTGTGNFRLASGTVDECDAGENGILQLTWNAELSSGQIEPEHWPETETWDLTWQAENYDVYEYCANPSAHVEVGQNPLKSQRTAIEQCLHPPVGNTIQTQMMLYSENNGLMRKLNENEQKILTWKLEGKKPIVHHPVIRQVKTWTNIPKPMLDQMLGAKKGQVKKPDVFDTPAQTFNLSGYTWVSQGSQLTTIQPDMEESKFNLQLNTQWIGALSVVEEFYSNNPQRRWTLGNM